MRDLVPDKEERRTMSVTFQSSLSRERADLKDRVKIAYPLEEFHYGMREFAIYDNA